jgi:hypothetical protein
MRDRDACIVRVTAARNSYLRRNAVILFTYALRVTRDFPGGGGGSSTTSPLRARMPTRQ